ncbi:hypothetical protein DFH28DRAFT_1123546 [Melampsora americana]|nr:hypothetical protein DFH28DRAFT_1134693 [Melampsora americana]KAH9818404.1 hypothetical protein DFH28DRAFT_1123546 [Melampsora americana]
MSLVKHIVGSQPSYMDLMYLLHPRDFLPDDGVYPKGTLTVAEDPNRRRAQHFRIHVIRELNEGNLQVASAGVDLHIQQYEVLNSSELCHLEHHRDLLVEEAVREAKYIMDDRRAFSQALSIPHQANFSIASQKVGFLGAIVKQEAERACHFEHSGGSTTTWPPYIASSYITEFLYRASAVLCQHEGSLTVTSTGALIIDPNPPVYEANSANVLPEIRALFLVYDMT